MIHRDLTLERWCKFSLFEQLANVGSDVDRTMQWKKHKNAKYSQNSFERVLELLDLTIADPKNKGGTLKELVRMREALVDYFMFDNQYLTDDEFWRTYFYGFGYAAAIACGR